MAIISIHEATVRFGGPPVLDGISLHVESGDRICLLGRNGAGKSTLLRLMAGTAVPDEGAVAISNAIHVELLGQGTVADFNGSALDYCTQRAVSAVDAEKILTKLGSDPHALFGTLSGGGRRRVMLAAALAAQADVLLLDEPTNHLDTEAVLWLEEFLRRSVGSLVLVTHDRAFARAVSNRVVEIDRGEVFSFSVGFDEFTQKRDELLATEQKQRRTFDKKLAAEEAWLRRGVKARRTRDEGRVRDLLRMREEYAARRTRAGQGRITVERAGKSGKLVVEATEISFAYPGADPIINDFSTTIMRGDRIGVVGPNGAGKTTLIKLLLGELAPLSGTVRRGANVAPLYFDQIRETLDPGKSVIENITGGDDTVVIGGRSKHINAYLADFLFEPERARMDVGYLSGGEQNRVMLAKLFTQPSNVLVMDEPTNDLDLETLDLLEQLVLDYEGTVIVVSHDREFLDNVATSSLIFTRSGEILELPGGYSDWSEHIAERERATLEAAAQGEAKRRAASAPGEKAEKSRNRERKLSYKETRELDALPELIAATEARIINLQHELADPALYQGGGSEVARITRELAAEQEKLVAQYARWEELEALQADSA
ncbi:MAG: ATP-binding cassette domain-containing protein [Spirochaetaceae bacterium]|nr:MAG: ATP-binding cassette domain-containing protein [Spirochaetaceae bacterium]